MIKRGETAFVAVLIIFSIAAFWLAFQIAGFTKWASPGVFPMLASATMLVSSLSIYLNNRKRRQEQHKHIDSATVTHTFNTDASDSVGNAPTETLPALPVPVVVMAVLLMMYIVAMPTLGFLLSSGLFLFASIGYLWKKPLWLSFIVSVLSLAIIHFIFRLVFQVILPQGTLITFFS